MRKLLSFVLLLFLLLFLAACDERQEPIELEPAEPLRVCLEIENYVSMTVTEQTSDTVTVTIQNDSRWTLGTDLPYVLEVYANGQWWSVPQSEYHAFPSIAGPPIFANNSLEFQENLAVFPIQRTGLYRIRREVIASGVQIDEQGNRREEYGPGTWHDLVAEFYWEG